MEHSTTQFVHHVLLFYVLLVYNDLRLTPDISDTVDADVRLVPKRGICAARRANVNHLHSVRLFFVITLHDRQRFLTWYYPVGFCAFCLQISLPSRPSRQRQQLADGLCSVLGGNV